MCVQARIGYSYYSLIRYTGLNPVVWRSKIEPACLTDYYEDFRQPGINKHNDLKHTRYILMTRVKGNLINVVSCPRPPGHGRGRGVTARESCGVATWIRFSYSHEVTGPSVAQCRGWQQIFRIQWGPLYTITSNVTQPSDQPQTQETADDIWWQDTCDVRCGQVPNWGFILSCLYIF